MSNAPLAQLDVIVPPIDEKDETTKISITDDDEDSFSTTPADDLKNDDDNSSIVEPNKPKIPDGGWGWMVVFSSLVLSLIQDGISFSFGILYIEFFDEFGASSSATSWVGSLFISVPLITGPIMSALVDKYGCRKMTIVGGLISTTGFILSSFARSITIMYLTFGILSGLGLGLTYITAVVSIAFWFDKKRNLAVGLGACGTGIGTFVYAPFTTYLLSEFGWRGTVRLLAGTLLNICVCGALMRDPEWIIEQNKQNSKISKSSKSSSLSVISEEHSEKMNLDDIRELLKSGKDAEYILQTLATSVKVEKDNSNMDHHQSVLNLPTYIKEDEKVPLEVLEHLSENKKLYKIILENYPSLLFTRSTSDKNLNKLAEDASLVTRIPVTFSLKLKKKDKPKELTHQYSLPDEPPSAMEPLMLPEKKPKITKSPPWFKQKFASNQPHSNYFKNMRFPRHSLIHRGAILNKNKYKLRASSCPNIYRVSMATIKDEDDAWYTIIIDTFKEMFDYSMFFEFHFFLMSVSTIFLFAWFMTPYFYLADHMDLSGYSKTQASFVMSTIGVTNTIGMVGLGWAGDQSWCNVPKTLATSLIICGIVCCSIMFFTSSYIILTISAAIYGATLAGSFAFTPVILVELLPLDRFTTAYGLNLLCQGIGHLGGPPLAGALYDITNSWETSFYLSGVFIVFSGFLILIIPFTKNRKLIGTGPVEKELANEK